MKVVFSNHSREKLELLKRHDFLITGEQVRNIVLNPDIEYETRKGRHICQKKLDEGHVLRVIYEEEENFKRVITLYPARRGRYES